MDGVLESVEVAVGFAAEVTEALVVPTAPTASMEVTMVEGTVETAIVDVPAASVDGPPAPKSFVTIDISANPTERR